MKKIIRVFALALCAAFSATPALAENSALEVALSVRHLQWDDSLRNRLEELAGGEQALVAQLIELSRSDEVSAPAAMRAAHILASHYVNQSGTKSMVVQAMASDIASLNRSGLARLYAKKVDAVSDKSAKRTLSAAVVDRASRDSSFALYAKQAQKNLN